MKLFWKSIFSFLLICVAFSPIYSQLISEETFDEANGSTAGTMTDGSTWSTIASGNCDGNPGTFSVQNGFFEIADLEGFNCCDCGSGAPGGACGDNQNSLSFNDIDISGYCGNVGIEIIWAGSSNMECQSMPDPSPVCIGGHDQLVATYSIDGAPEVQFGYLCGNTVLQVPVTPFNLSGNDLDIIIRGGNQAAAELYSIDRVIVSASAIGGGSGPTGSLTGGGDLCEGECQDISWNITGGTPNYEVDYLVTVGALTLPFSVPSSASMGNITVCLDGTVGFPFANYDAGTNTVNLNPSVGSLITIEMAGIEDATGCSSVLSGQSISFNLFSAPSINNIPDITVCNTDPDIDLSQFSSSVSSSGTVTWYSDMALTMPIGPIIPVPSGNQTIYAIVTDSNGCESESIEVDIMVTIGPDIFPQNLPTIICGSYTLEEILGTNLSGNQAYFAGPNGSPPSFAPGEIIDFDITLFIYDIINGCSDEETITINIEEGPEITPFNPVNACNFYILPDLVGNNLTGSGNYFSLPNQNGQSFQVGDTVFSSTVLYAFDFNGVCFDEEPILINITDGPEILMPEVLSGCGSITLPIISGNNLPGSTAYFTAGQGTGVEFNPGDMISSSQTLFIYAEENGCVSEVSIMIDLSAGPSINPIDSVFACDFYELPVITGQSLNDPVYFDNSSLNGIPFAEGDTIFNEGAFFAVDSVPGSGACISIQEFYISFVDNPNAGNDEILSFCSSAIFPAVNLLDDNIDASGNFIDPMNSGVLNNDTIDLNLLNVDSILILYVLDNLCGSDTALIEIETINLADAGDDSSAELCGGAVVNLDDLLTTGNPGGQFFNTTGNSPVFSLSADTLPLDGSAIDYFYIVGDGSSCPFDTAILSVSLGENPEIEFPQSFIDACNFFELSAIPGTDLDGTESYFTDSEGNGTPLNAGDTIFSSTTIYAYIDKDGCMAEDTLEIQINSGAQTFINETICNDDTLVVNGIGYHFFNNSGTQSIMTANGCDSMLIINLEFFPTDTNFITQTLCFGTSITVNGVTYDEDKPDGQQIFPFADKNGCDSVIVIDLNFSEANVTPISDMICQNDSININGTFYSINNPSGMDTITLPNGCDSILDVSIDFMNISTGDLDTTLCSSDFILLNGTIYDQSNPTGMENLQGQNAEGCDSLVEINLDFYSVEEGLLTGTYCVGDVIDTLGETFSVDMPEMLITLPGASAQNCDSTVLVSFEFQSSGEGLIEDEICETSSIEIEGTVYDISNPTGFFTVQNEDGCDSIVNVSISFFVNTISSESGRLSCNEDGGFVVLTEIAAEGPYDVIVDGDINNVLNINIGDTLFGFDAGEHVLELTNEEGCIATETFIISNVEFEEINIPEIVTIQEGDSYTLNLDLNNSELTVVWSPNIDISCVSCIDPVFTPSEDMEYILTLTDIGGCITMDTILIRVEQVDNVYIPNIFSPNDDGLNDRFVLFDEAGGTYDLFVYDRWGNKVYEGLQLAANDVNSGWNGQFNGRNVQSGVYVYYIRYYMLIDNTPTEPIELNGSITVVK